MARRPADPEEELRWMSQEVRSYVEAVLSSLAANVPKVHIPASVNIYGFMYLSNFFIVFYAFQAIVLCQVEKAKEDMLNQLYSSIRLMFCA
jgi:dynamin 1/3